jgi:hypothetical protein
MIQGDNGIHTALKPRCNRCGQGDELFQVVNFPWLTVVKVEKRLDGLCDGAVADVESVSVGTTNVAPEVGVMLRYFEFSSCSNQLGAYPFPFLHLQLHAFPIRTIPELEWWLVPD